MAAPPIPRLRATEIGEKCVRRPHFADINFTIGVFNKMIAGKPFLRNAVIFILFHTRIDDGNYFESHILQNVEHVYRIAESLLIPRKYAISVHVMNIEINNIGRNLLLAESFCEVQHFAFGIIAPATLLITE